MDHHEEQESNHADLPRTTRALNSPANATSSLVQITREYCTLFQHGIDAHSLHEHVHAMSTTPDRELLAKQLAFLTTALEPSCDFKDGCGVDALVDQWKRYTLYHTRFTLELLDTTVQQAPTGEITVHWNCALHVRFTRKTIEAIFPHVLQHEELIQRLIGRQVSYRGTNKFEFSKNHRVAVYDANVAFAEALAASGLDADDVAIIMGQALVDKNCLLAADPETTSSDSVLVV